RKMSLIGDAIAHAVLPGIVIAFLLTSGRNTLPMLIGAGFFGLLTVYLTEEISKRGRIFHDASMGIVFTTLFSIGIILISLFARNVDIDQECVLFGEIAYVPWDLWIIGETSIGPRPFWILLFVFSMNLAFVLFFYKELKTYSFSPQLALTLGLPAGLIHYMLMGSVSVTTVASFESVGAILVLALLIVPPATAYLLTERLSRMLILSVCFGVSSVFGGYYFALWINSSIAGAIAVVSGLQFALVLYLSPSHGLLWKSRADREHFEEPFDSLEGAQKDSSVPAE
ncbi:metal ABC transporter permease, partial [Balneolaceae bacterium ANBcel3]|nr:metal ABC transporter permease [Balneolaceae bacterium ANBcel3]